MKSLFSFVLAFTVAIAPALAQESLTGNQVEHFLNTLERLGELPELTKEDPEPIAEMSPAELQEKMRAPFTSSLGEMRDNEQFAEGLAIMQSEGFEDEEEWAAVGDRVMFAYAALQMPETKPDVDAQMAQALKDLEASDLPEEMKQKMRDAMVISKGMVDAVDDVPEADIEAVRPFIDRFESLAKMPRLEQ